MCDNLPLETEIAQLSPDVQYLVRECAHQVQLVLDHYKTPQVIGLALQLVEAQRQASIRY